MSVLTHPVVLLHRVLPLSIPWFTVLPLSHRQSFWCFSDLRMSLPWNFKTFSTRLNPVCIQGISWMNLWRDVEGETNVWRRRRMTTWSGAAIDAMLSQAYLLNIFKKIRGQKNSVSEKNSRAFLIRKLNASGFFEVLPNKLYAPEFFDAFFTEEANFSKESKEF